MQHNARVELAIVVAKFVTTPGSIVSASLSDMQTAELRRLEQSIMAVGKWRDQGFALSLAGQLALVGLHPGIEVTSAYGDWFSWTANLIFALVLVAFAITVVVTRMSYNRLSEFAWHDYSFSIYVIASAVVFVGSVIAWPISDWNSVLALSCEAIAIIGSIAHYLWSKKQIPKLRDAVNSNPGAV